MLENLEQAANQVEPAWSAPQNHHSGPGQWHAMLDLRIARRGPRTIVEHAHHNGPLRIQKALYPDHSGQMDVLILHPPGGIAGGDHLSIKVQVGAGAHARITTPGAAKWYRCKAQAARQDLHLQLNDDAVLEWLPQESIVFDRAQVESLSHIYCTTSTRACGWDIWMLGRRHSGESFSEGHIRQQTRLYRDGVLLWSERTVLSAQDPLRRSALGWNNKTVMGCFWALGLPNDESLIAHCREVSVEGLALGITRFEHGLLLARALGDSAEAVRRALSEIWSRLRQPLCGAPGIAPRIWST